MLDSNGRHIIDIKLCLMMEVIAVSVMSHLHSPSSNRMGIFFFEVPSHVDSFRFSGHLCPELIESSRISVRVPGTTQIHQQHSLPFRGGQRLVLHCSVCVFQ